MNKSVQKYFAEDKTIKNISLIIVIGLVFLISAVAYAKKTNPPAQMPEFTQVDPAAWINSKPLSVKDLRGKVILIDVWTYGCWNCYKSFPWLRALEDKFSDQDFQVIGIHSPEFDREKERDNVVKKVEEFMLHHPVMMDNNRAYWRSLHNRYWPAYYIVDKEGNIRDAFIGETHAGDRNAKKIEKLITKLLK
ncbi:MAG: redoxin family protein [Gammaproteobacteria bacterium]|jgi:glutathione peroxidase-family protein|nr:redoxin family protein [Gammaproteobacteria bacterium]